MRIECRSGFLLSVAVALLSLSACTVNELVSPEETALVVAAEEKPEHMLLDVGLIQFGEGVDAKNVAEKTGIYEDIRNAESRYLPYHLKTTLQDTGHWGAVRVLPSVDFFTDVIVSGSIKKSDGEFAEIEIDVSDATGRHWYKKTYSTQTGLSSYSEYRDRTRDPYQNLFNDVANDLHAYASTLGAKDIETIQHVSELKFFEDMAPNTFGEHLQRDKDGRYLINRLPADNDPTVDRLRQIRERDRLVVDTLNEHYANFYYGIAIPYESWRKTSREESINYRQVRRSGLIKAAIGVAIIAGSAMIDTDDPSDSRRRRNTMRGIQNVAISQGIETIAAGMTRRQEANMYRESIKELSESFGDEAAPMVIEVSGQVRRLTGTAAAQYESWRRLLREIYAAETGFPQDVEVGVPGRSAEPSG